MPVNIEITGLEELTRRFRAFPGRLRKAMDITMLAAITTLWENVPPYPAKPTDSTYRRTGTLGKTLGVDMSGKKSGEPQIFKVRTMGSGSLEGVFGTNLKYAPFVIGERSQTKAHRANKWWTILTIAKNASAKIVREFNLMADKLAKFLDRGV